MDLIEFDLALRQRLGLIRLLVRVEDVHILEDRVLVAERLHTPSFSAITYKTPVSYMSSCLRYGCAS
ncbi:hypothetical protein [Halorubrum sp. GN11GM_10-3_MGM]|uniref:hypothetical protein n=1 Tax=Halorubrum sp. GN11GM_10-3_MGM TaxID=2518111 RepID=UPI001F54702B|nr:hypothetical protein [Halorubrum sp. GN11GM_10-3_MGM]